MTVIDAVIIGLIAILIGVVLLKRKDPALEGEILGRVKAEVQSLRPAISNEFSALRSHLEGLLAKPAESDPNFALAQRIRMAGIEAAPPAAVQPDPVVPVAPVVAAASVAPTNPDPELGPTQYNATLVYFDSLLQQGYDDAAYFHISPDELAALVKRKYDMGDTDSASHVKQDVDRVNAGAVPAGFNGSPAAILRLGGAGVWGA